MMDFILKIILGFSLIVLIVVLCATLLMFLDCLYADVHESPLLHDIKTLIRKYRESSEQKGDDNEIIKD